MILGIVCNKLLIVFLMIFNSGFVSFALQLGFLFFSERQNLASSIDF